MKLSKITVRSGTTYNHPTQQYSNLQASCEIEALVEESDDPAIAIKELQAQADSAVAQHKQQQLDAIHVAKKCLEEAKEPQRERTWSDFKPGEMVEFNDDLKNFWARGDKALVINSPHTTVSGALGVSICTMGSERKIAVAPQHLKYLDHYIPF